MSRDLVRHREWAAARYARLRSEGRCIQCCRKLDCKAVTCLACTLKRRVHARLYAECGSWQRGRRGRVPVEAR